MEWANKLQGAVITEWTEGVQKNGSHKAKQELRKKIAEKYDITSAMVQGIIRLMATEGLERKKARRGRGWGYNFEPTNYHELVAGLKQRIEDLERRFAYIVEGIQTVMEDGATFAIHLQQLQTIGKRVGVNTRRNGREKDHRELSGDIR